MRWIIKDVFGDETIELVKALKNNNVDYEYSKNLLHFECGVFLRGSIEFVKDYQDIAFVTGFIDFDKFKCSWYYPFFKHLMYNSSFMMLPKGCILQNKENLPWLNNRIFLRPDSGCKEFTGTTIGKKWFEKELEIVLKDIPDAEMILIAPDRQSPPEEYRAVIGPGGKLISISQKSFNDVDLPYVFRYEIEEFCKNFKFPPLNDFYTIDFCEAWSTLHIMEVNSFNCAGLYDVDYDKVVKAVKEYYE